MKTFSYKITKNDGYITRKSELFTDCICIISFQLHKIVMIKKLVLIVIISLVLKVHWQILNSI